MIKIRKKEDKYYLKNNELEINNFALVLFGIGFFMLFFEANEVLTLTLFAIGCLAIFQRDVYIFNLRANEIIIKKFFLSFKINIIKMDLNDFNEMVFEEMYHTKLFTFWWHYVYKIELIGNDKSIYIGTLDLNSDDIDELKIIAIRAGYNVKIKNLEKQSPFL